MDKDSLRALSRVWRDRAETLRRYGSDASAATLEACADDLDEALRGLDETLLTLEQAAAESGYSAEHLGRLVREGKVRNAGRKGAPRIARQDLPRKAGEVAEVIPIREIDYRQIVRSAISEGAA
jgi:hypothetical protein